MFFNHLLSLTTLKNCLLNATSFSQVYSGEKLPLHKFRKEGAMLSPLIAGLLAACGGGGGVVLGGAQVTSGAGADRVLYRYDSGGDGVNWVGQDGDDTIVQFERGVDKLVLIDIHDNPITDLATFDTGVRGDDTLLDSSDDEITISFLDPDSDGDNDGVLLTFAGGSNLTINFVTALTTLESTSFSTLEDLLDGSVDSFDGIELTTSIDII